MLAGKLFEKFESTLELELGKLPAAAAGLKWLRIIH
jgi:hypothetical protein